MALYVPALHIDTDGDGLPQNGESYTAVGMTWAVFITGEIPESFGKLGVQEGWNAIIVSKHDDPEFGDPVNISMPVNLAPNLELVAGGALSFDPDGMRVMLISGQTFTGGTSLGPLLDAPLTDPWELILSGPPAAERFYEIPEMGMTAAVEVPLSYADTDNSGDFDETVDQALYGACSDGSMVGFLWLPPPTDLHAAFAVAQLGTGTGWMGVSLSEEGGMLESAALSSLVMDEGCGPGGG
jgi:hypothetical protein